jgi:hypothetical protein
MWFENLEGRVHEEECMYVGRENFGGRVQLFRVLLNFYEQVL